MKPYKFGNLIDWTREAANPRLTTVSGMVFLDGKPVTWYDQHAGSWEACQPRFDEALALLGITSDDLETTPADLRHDRNARILCGVALFLGFTVLLALLFYCSKGLMGLIEITFF